MKISFRPIKSAITKSAEVFQRLNTTRARQGERMARWVEKKLHPQQVPAQINPPELNGVPAPLTDRIKQLFSIAMSFDDGIESVSESSGQRGENISELVRNLMKIAAQLNKKLSSMDEAQTAEHFDSGLMQYELQTLQQLARGIGWSTASKLGQSQILTKAAGIAAEAEAILSNMPPAPIDVAYICKEVREEGPSQHSNSDSDSKDLSSAAKEEKKLATKTLLETINNHAPTYSSDFDYIHTGMESWGNEEGIADHVVLGTDVHAVNVRIRLEVLYCMKELENDPLVEKHLEKEWETLKKGLEYLNSNIATLEAGLETRANELLDDAHSGSV